MDWWCPDPQTRLNDNVRFSRGTLSKATTAASAERQRLVKKSQSTQPSEVVTISQYIWMSGNRLVWRKQVAIHIIYIIIIWYMYTYHITINVSYHYGDTPLPTACHHENTIIPLYIYIYIQIYNHSSDTSIWFYYPRNQKHIIRESKTSFPSTLFQPLQPLEDPSDPSVTASVVKAASPCRPLFESLGNHASSRGRELSAPPWPNLYQSLEIAEPWGWENKKQKVFLGSHFSHFRTWNLGLFVGEDTILSLMTVA